VIALPPPKPACYRFADLILDVRASRLTRADEPIGLGKLTFDLLRALVELAPAVVSRGELIERVWHRRYVSPETLIQRVSLLRHALSDCARTPRYIRVVHGRGYSLVPRVESLTQGACKPALAVLPFESLSRDPDRELFAAGMHEEILSRLARVPALRVLARTNVKRYAKSQLPIREIAAELGVSVVMEGSVRYAADRVRITAQLIDGDSSAHLWAQVYDCALGDELEIQTYVAHAIAKAFEEVGVSR
jgi:TolB-like protein